MDTDYEALKTALQSYPRSHVSIHGVRKISDAVSIAMQVAGQPIGIHEQNTAFSITADLERGGTLSIFVSKTKDVE